MKRWAPPLMRICVFLLLGAIVNVAVAWGLALALRANTTNPIQQGWAALEAVKQSKVAFGNHTHWHVRRFAKAGSLLIVVTCVGHPYETGLDFDSLLPPVQGMAEDIAEFEERGATIDHPGYFYWDGRGWPCLALAAHWSWFDRTAWPHPPITQGIDVSPGRPSLLWPYGVHELRALPLTPLWPGFAINTLFYAAILWLLFATTFALRRRRRIKRGLCPKCAYPIGSSEVCTECGAAVPLSLAAVGGPRESG